MQTKNSEFVLAAAWADRDEPFALAVRNAIEVGTIFPSKLRANLEAAGYTIVEDTAALSEYGFRTLATLQRVVVRDEDGDIVAMGAAGDADEAILAAALGWFREHPVAGVDPSAPIFIPG